MNVPYICQRCSRQLIRSPCQRPNSGFVSLGQLVRRDDENRTALREVPQDNGELAATGPPPRKKPLTFAQRYQEQRKPKGVDKVLETLFASNRGHEQALDKSRYSRIPKYQAAKAAESERSAVEKSIDRRLGELHNKLRRGTAPLQEIWRDCESLLGARKWALKDALVTGDKKRLFDHSTTMADTPAYIRTFREILLAICRKQRLVSGIPNVTPADAIRTYTKHGAMRNWWSLVLWCQLGQVLQLSYQSTNEIEGAASKEKIRLILGEVLEVWTAYEEKYGPTRSSFRTVLLSEDPDEVNGKASDNVDDGASTLEVSSSLAKNQQLKPPDEIAVAAKMTLECLGAVGMEVPSRIMSISSRFGQALTRDRSIATRRLLGADVSPKIVEKAMKGWETHPVPEQKEIFNPTETSNISHVRKNPLSVSQKHSYQDWEGMDLRKRLHAIGAASERSDPKLAVRLWHQFQVHVEATKAENEKESNEQIYVRFLRTFWALRRHDEAVEVWNHMIESGYLPRPRHWTAMLTGCIIAKDAQSLQTIWINMLRSGMSPDCTTWTTYIHGLIDCHKWEEGLKALEQLGRIWKSAPPLEPADTADNNQHTESPEDETILRPKEAPVCAALSALIHTNRRHLIPRVLAWARSHQVPLSNHTFNILLRPIVRHESQAAIQDHLQQMAAANCTPDVATFTIILNGLVSNSTSTFHSLPPEAQEDTIMSILADMQRQGIVSTPFTYSTLLDGLLTPGSKGLEHNYTPNVPAARTVLAHMAARNIYPSRHIYTILITHYFTRQPIPDLPAVSSLWSSIHHSGQSGKLDNIFFDRLIEGYADANEIDEALKFLQLAPQMGNTPGWGALVRLLRALVRGKEWGLCGELVEDVEREDGPLRVGQGRVQGRAKVEFWELVDLLREKGLLRVNEER